MQQLHLAVRLSFDGKVQLAGELPGIFLVSYDVFRLKLTYKASDMPILANGRLCMQHFRPKTSYDTGKMSVNLAGPGSLRLSPMISFSPQFWSQIPDFDHKYCKYIARQNLYKYCSRSIASGRASL